jgi:hypothetical protein
MPNVARVCGMSERRVRLALGTLRRLGLVVLIQESRGGVRAPPVYGVVPPEAWPSPETTGLVTLHEVQGSEPATLHEVPSTLHEVPTHPAPRAVKGTPMKVLPEGKANTARGAGLAWTAVAHRLRDLMLSEELFATWARPLEGSLTENVLSVRAPGSDHANYWRKREDILTTAARQAGLTCSIRVVQVAAR